ncbi:MAG: hypothetical protein C4345_08685 [Chloroflexota bacterium]
MASMGTRVSIAFLGTASISHGLAPCRPEPVLLASANGQSQARSPLKFPAPLAVTVSMQNLVGLT